MEYNRTRVPEKTEGRYKATDDQRPERRRTYRLHCSPRAQLYCYSAESTLPPCLDINASLWYVNVLVYMESEGGSASKSKSQLGTAASAQDLSPARAVGRDHRGLHPHCLPPTPPAIRTLPDSLRQALGKTIPLSLAGPRAPN